MKTNKVRISYDGSKGWLIFWAIVLFPVAMVLMLTAGSFQMDNTTYKIRYDGSRCWLAFWTVVCFPIAGILFLLNGFEAVINTTSN